MVACCNVVIMAVKPHILPGVLKQVHDLVTKDHLFISVVTGTTLAQFKEVSHVVDVQNDSFFQNYIDFVINSFFKCQSIFSLKNQSSNFSFGRIHSLKS